MAQDKVRRLGRGLDALMHVASSPSRQESRVAGSSIGEQFQTVAVAAIVPNPLQPRKEFSETELGELRSSIRANGLLQPLLVRPRGSTFQLIAGERRFRAVQALGWREVPVHVRDLDDKDVLTLALIENLQRSDLNPIEEAEGYQELMTRFSLTQQEVADAVGRERSTVANMLRLLALPEGIRTMVRAGDLSLGHARALLGLSSGDQMHTLAREAAGGGMTVRTVERRVRELAANTKRRARHAKAPATRPAEAQLIEAQLRRKLQTDVTVTVTSGGKGEVRISFYSADDLERLLDLMVGPDRESI
ncbi:MAG TPA: ParB/RepB/Spo0J family partition protein [Gemmatimonadaceae bacterium]|nr:ParB/RepB/Spo0J family partition protein [Gemmatimonadaceae bacterium]